MSAAITFELSQAVVAALRADQRFAGAVVLDNPSDPAASSEGSRIVFIEDKSDAPINQPGTSTGRTFTLAIGVITRTTNDRVLAAMDMTAANDVTFTALVAKGKELLQAKRIVNLGQPREGMRGYRIEGLDVGGALIFTTFEIDYRCPSRMHAGA